MKYIGLSMSGIIQRRFWTQIDVSRYYVEHLWPNFAVMRQTKKLQNLKRGRKAFIFANGPSVRKLDPAKVRSFQHEGYDVFAVNSYFHSEMSHMVLPNYFVLSDPAYFGHTTGLSEQRKQEVEGDLFKIVANNCVLFAPIEYYSKLDYTNKYAFCDAENIFSPNVCDITRPRGYLSMTAYKALSIACFLGYEHIYICGFDNNYFKTFVSDIDNKLYIEDIHFYDNTRQRRYVEPHSFGWGDGSVGQALYLHHLLFEQLRKFSRYPIINLDPEGLVDCFNKHHDLDIYNS